ncbi:MAG: MMPL family transporter [Nanoarchaeota archaeon]|nr:MMPL family transporter [Nanoarchaeota archaeon]
MAKLFTTRVWILLAFIIFAILAISPQPWAKGIVIQSIGEESTEANQGFSIGEKILSINNRPIMTIQDYQIALKAYNVEQKNITVTTTEGSTTYPITTNIGFTVDENLTITTTTLTTDLTIGTNITHINNQAIPDFTTLTEVIDTILPQKTITITTNNKEYAYLTTGNIDLRVTEAKKSNIKKGLELAGGSRVIIKPESNETITDKHIQDLISVLENRLNVYGLADLKIRAATDLGGNKFVVVELAGATREEIRELIGKQGVFEAKIGDDVVFKGGKGDLPFVCREDGSCSGIVPPCTQEEGTWFCNFRFQIKLSEEAAQRHANVTEKLTVNGTPGNAVLSKNLDMYLDGKLVNSLNIAADLKGRAITDIVITGPGTGATQEEAVDAAIKEMNKLQTILITGSLPVKITIVKADTISPLLGKEFLNNSIIVGFVALFFVGLIVFIRYRNIKIALPIMFIVFIEIFITIGIAALFKQNFDLASIAGLIAAVGTGVDDQLIITDEALKKETEYLSWKQKIKRAFGIIIGAAATIVVAMIPLWFAGAGLLRGFAVTTIIGVAIGTLITRPAYASIITWILEE